MIKVKTTDGIDIECGQSDAAHPPMPPGQVYRGMLLNTGATWIRTPGDEWIKCQNRSITQVKSIIESNTISDLRELISLFLV